MVKQVKADSKDKKVHHKTQPVRLYQNGIFTGFRRGKTTQNCNQALITIANCNDKLGASWYLGKRVAYIWKAKKTVNNTRFRVSWGKVVNTHGHQGAVRVSFRRNLTARAMGAKVRVMLYPNKSDTIKNVYHRDRTNYKRPW